MSATNASGINSAKYQTLKRFLALYGVLVIVILALLGTLYHQYSKTQMISSHRLAMQLESESYVPALKQWLEQDRNLKTFPEDLAYTTALYGYDQKLLVGNLKNSSLNFKESITLEEGYVHLIVPLAPYGLGDFYLVFETSDDGLWQTQAIETAFLLGLLLFAFLLLIGFILARLLLHPMNEAIALLDNFIKDTTHELNTPISAILTNLEALKEEPIPVSLQKKLKRIEIASRTISTLYNDLTYLVLNHDLAVINEPLDVSELLEERLEYFRHHIEQKKIYLELTITPHILLVIDRTKMTRIIDNLLSNAIKYNKMNGTIAIALNEGTLCIEDNGIGIPSSMITQVFERYTRADKSVGGFGIGLHIVAMIAKEYSLDIAINSEEKKGTKICVGWKLDT
ncbi:MAG: HAMP domain-containing sensor histidine kinase [Sulfuricurvum sp.]|nr:HAMP domain-containing sensor histidine kinase [Sulfuricurvum sp.]